MTSVFELIRLRDEINDLKKKNQNDNERIVNARKQRVVLFRSKK